MEGALLALADFYERFHTDVLNYHGSTLVEFLNNIRWGIHYYLHPQYKQSMTRELGTLYHISTYTPTVYQVRLHNGAIGIS